MSSLVSWTLNYYVKYQAFDIFSIRLHISAKEGKDFSKSFTFLVFNVNKSHDEREWFRTIAQLSQMVKQDRGELENVVSGIDGVTSNNTSTDYTGRSLECCSIRGHNGASKDLNLRI